MLIGAPRPLPGSPARNDLVRLLAVVATLTLVACVRTATPPDRVPSGAMPLDHEPIPEAADPRWSAIEGPSARLVQSYGEWENLWRNLTRGVSPIPAPPPVDFHEEVVAILSTEAGREIAITGAWRAGDRLFVEAVEIVPGPDCPTAMTGENSVAAIRVKRWHGIEGRFIERLETRDCRAPAP